MAQGAEAAEGFRVLLLDEVDSTNNVVKRALREGEPSGLVVRAYRQTGGYGRQGRSWTSPEGGLYCSWLLRPDVPTEQLPTLSLVVAVAFRRALASLAGDVGRRIMVKWPNDVVIADASVDAQVPGAGEGVPSDAERAASFPSFRKLVGISLEAVGGGVCVGTGVNVVPPRGGAMPVGGKNTAGFMADVAPDLAARPWDRAVDAVFDAVASSLAECYGLWAREGFGSFVGEFDAHHVLAGAQVGVRDREGGLIGEGVVRRVGEQGRLVLAGADGDERAVASGEAHIERLG